jgi:hypothetical protein
MRVLVQERFPLKGMILTESNKGICSISEILIPNKTVVLDLPGNRIASIRSTDTILQLQG